MQRWRLLRPTAAALLLVWLAVPLAALAAGVHAADHDHHGERSAADLASSAPHGHHHDAATADHDHSAWRGPAAPAMLPPPRGRSLATAPLDLRPLTAPSGGETPPPTGSPPLFYTLCALLL